MRIATDANLAPPLDLYKLSWLYLDRRCQKLEQLRIVGVKPQSLRSDHGYIGERQRRCLKHITSYYPDYILLNLAICLLYRASNRRDVIFGENAENHHFLPVDSFDSIHYAYSCAVHFVWIVVDSCG